MLFHLLSGRHFLPATLCRSCIPGAFRGFLEAGTFRGSRFMGFRKFFRLPGISMGAAVFFPSWCFTYIFRLVFIKTAVILLPWHIPGTLRLHKALPDQLQGIDIALVAVSQGFEHLPAGAAALDLLCIGEQSVKAADQVVHLVNGVEGACKPGKGQVAAIVELVIREQRPVRRR